MLYLNIVARNIENIFSATSDGEAVTPANIRQGSYSSTNISSEIQQLKTVSTQRALDYQPLNNIDDIEHLFEDEEW